MKVLIYASVASMIKQFNMPNIELLKSLGYQVDVACNFEFGSAMADDGMEIFKKKLKEINVNYYHIPIPRKIGDINNIRKSLIITKELLELNEYDLIHCHSPIGGVIARLANKKSKFYSKTTMIYTAHGFHFFKGAPKRNWLIYYPIEKYFSKFTDVIITINKEDYKTAQNKFKHPKIYKINGVGIEYNKIIEAKRDNNLRDKLKLQEKDLVIISVGELNSNKNHIVIINAIKKLNNKNVKYLIAGKGPLEDKIRNEITSNGLDDQIFLLGYRNDVYSICKIADVFAFPSKREGLGLAAIEGMAAGLFLITSNVHGINDYSINNVTGRCTEPTNINEFKEIINWCFSNLESVHKIGISNINRAKKYGVDIVETDMKKIYRSIKSE